MSLPPYLAIRLVIAGYGLYLIGGRARGYFAYRRRRLANPDEPRDDLWENWGLAGAIALAGFMGGGAAIHFGLPERTFWFFFAVAMVGALMLGWAGVKLSGRDRAQSAV